MKVDKEKSILFIIASREFRDEEYFIPRDILEKNGFNIKVASDRKGTALGVYGGDVNIDLQGEEINILDFMAVIFVGGAGALKCLDKDIFHRIIIDAKEKNIVLAAICIAPLILANTGVLKGIKATVWSSKEEKRAVKELKEKGAIYEEKGVVIDDNIITASGPDQAENFAKMILKKLTE